MFRPGNPREHRRSRPGLRLPADETPGRRRESGRKNDSHRTRLRHGPRDCARCPKQNPHDRRHRRSRRPARLGSALEPEHDQRSRTDEARDGIGDERFLKRHRTLIEIVAIALLTIGWFWVFFQYPIVGMSVGFLAVLAMGALVFWR